jgi:hypothetical protein
VAARSQIFRSAIRRSNGGGSSSSSSSDVADWPIADPRFYALDPDGGNDGAVGYGGTMAAAGAVAKATAAALEAILPPVGNGRAIVVAIKPRAAGATIPGTFAFRGKTGYRSIRIAGTTDFSDSATDRILAGAIVASAGPGAGGAWTVAAAPAPTVATWAIAAGALPAESTIVQKRVRWVGNVTAALAGVCVNIAEVVAGAGGTITGGNNLPAAPAAGDEFFIEHPGVMFDRVDIAGEGGSLDSSPEAISTFSNGLVLCGLAATNFQVSGPGRLVRMSFCEQRGAGVAALEGVGVLVVDPSTRTQTGGAVGVGAGLRVEGTQVIRDCGSLSWRASGHIAAVGTGAIFQRISAYAIGQLGSYFGSGVSIVSSGGFPAPRFTLGLSGIAALDNVFGREPAGVATSRRTRIVGPPTELVAGGLVIRDSNCRISGVSVTNQGAIPCIRGDGQGMNLAINDAIGSAGNTDVGIDVQGCRQSQIALGVDIANTIEGTVGQVRLPGPEGSVNVAVTTHAGFTITNIVDERGNNVQGTAGSLVGRCVLVLNDNGTAIVVGNVVKKDGAVGFAIRLAQGDTLANAVGVQGVMVTDTADAAHGYMAQNGVVRLRASAAVSPAELLAYLSAAAAGEVDDVPPADNGSNQKLRLGWILANDLIGGVNYARVPWQPELLPILSDGAAP